MSVQARTENTRKLLAQSTSRIIQNGGLRSLTIISASLECGIARATVYNYVRDKDQLFSLAIADFFKELQEISLSDFEHAELGLVALANFVAEHPLILGLRTFNADVLIEGIGHVLTLDDEIATAAMEALQSMGFHSDLTACETVLRWISSFAVTPGQAAEREAGAYVLASSLKTDAGL